MLAKLTETFMESKLKKELYEKYKDKRDEKMWLYITVGLGLLCGFYFGGHLVAYWIMN
jgi:hypothetical protein